MRSDQPCAFQRVIPVDQLNAEAFGLGIHHQRMAGREAVEGVAARLLVQMGARDIDRRIGRG